MRIYADRALVSGKWVKGCTVTLDQGRIRSVERGTSGDVRVPILTPGLFDKHLHGGYGFDTTYPDWDRCAVWLDALAQRGVTHVLYTMGSGPAEATERAMRFVHAVMCAQAEGRMGGARVMGVHLEGPFINPEKKGAMDAAHVLAPTPDHFARMTGAHSDIVRAVTMAPEVPGAHDMARYLAARGIRVQMGHTAIDYAGMDAAVEAGFSGITHAFNAMAGIHHREPGPMVYGMLNDRLCLEVICDLVHLSAPIIEMLFRLRGASGIALVSDTGMAAGLADGEYTAGDRYVRVQGGRNYTRSGGIAGSYHALDVGVRHVIALGIAPEAAFCAASTTPARYLGFSTLGDIAPGYDAGLAGWDEDYRCVWRTA